MGQNEPILGETEGFTVEDWRKTYPMDYLKALDLLDRAESDAAKDYTMRQLFDVCKLHIPDSLFKYYGLDNDEGLNGKKLDTLARSQVYGAKISMLNDPFDCRSAFYHPEILIKEFGFDPIGAIGDMASWNLVSSFTACDENSMPMWAHYGSNHAGYCVEYDMTIPENQRLKGLIFPVRYENRRVDLTDFYSSQFDAIIHSVRQNSAMGIKRTVLTDLSLVYFSLLLCNIKHPSWSYEKEFRCSFAVNASGAPYTDAKPKAIYIGRSCAPEKRDRLLQIGSDLHLPVYQMIFNPESSECLLDKKLLATN